MYRQCLGSRSRFGTYKVMLTHCFLSANSLNYSSFCLSMQAAYGQALFDNLAHMVYYTMDLYTQYQHYLTYLDLQPLPLGTLECSCAEDVSPGSKVLLSGYV